MESAGEVEFVFEPQLEGGYHAYAPELPGLHTQGDSLEEATANAEEALALYVEGGAAFGNRSQTACPPRRSTQFMTGCRHRRAGSTGSWTGVATPEGKRASVTSVRDCLSAGQQKRRRAHQPGGDEQGGASGQRRCEQSTGHDE